MPVRKNKYGIYCTDFRTGNGERIRKSTKTKNKKLAQRFEDNLKEQYYRVEHLGEKPKYTMYQAYVRYLKEKEDKKSLDDDKYHIETLKGLLGNIPLIEVTRDKILELRETRKKQKVIRYKKKVPYETNKQVTPATVNRMLEVLRTVLRMACNEWEWIDKAPDVPMLKVIKDRIRWITKEESERLLAQLPMHLNAITRFALATGLRARNITGMKWSYIQLTQRIARLPGTFMKNGTTLQIPLNKQAMIVLRELEQIANGMDEKSEFVFLYQGQPIKECNTKAFRDAVKRAEIEDFRFHDLRHTWASWHVQNGTPLHVLQELGGWNSYEMVKRYAHLSTEHLAEHVDNIGKLEILSQDLVRVEKAGDENSR